MKKKGRYDVSGSIEAQFEPGSNDTVLRNKLGIADSDVMDRIEAEALIKATDALFHEYDVEHKFNAGDICHMHKVWLGDIYEWAGNYRSVNISKGDFSFAMAAQIPKLMDQFEKDQLTKYTPCRGSHRTCFDPSVSRRQWQMLAHIGNYYGVASRIANFRL